MSEWQSGDLRFEILTPEDHQGGKTVFDLGQFYGWFGVFDHKRREMVALFPSSNDAITYTARLNRALS